MGSNYAGVDWASEKHDILVADEPIVAATFAHDERGLTALCNTLVRLKVQLVAIERPDGLLIERLLDAGLRVMAIHPNQVAAARPRFRTSGGKSDRSDAFVLCELARTDSHRFRVLVPDGDQTKALRALTRAREDLVKTRVALANQLRTELERFWPGAAVIFNDIDSPISLAFINRYPSPNDAHGRGAQRLGWFLARHAYSGGKQPAQLIRKLRNAPEGRAGDQEIEARRDRAHARHGDRPARRQDQRADLGDRSLPARSPRRSHLPVAVQRTQERRHRRRGFESRRRLRPPVCTSRPRGL
jgi:Transposase